MNRSLFRLLAGGGLGLALAVGLATRAADPPAGVPNNPVPRADLPKRVIEMHAQRLLAAGAAPAGPPAAGAGFVNPKVQPGKVRWHADYATACRASAQSGKPVLLFQMMGRLDEKFC
jgi:hypothetical protein